MAEIFVATDGSDSNDGTSIAEAYKTLTRANANSPTGLFAGDTVFLIVKKDGNGVPETFSGVGSDVGTITISASGTDAGGVIKWRAANENGVVDGTMAVIDFAGKSLTAGGIHIVAHNILFQNISVENTENGAEGFLDDNIGANSNDNGTRLFFYGCVAKKSGHHGFRFNSGNNFLYQCYAVDCDQYFSNGFHFEAGGGTNNVCFGCISEGCEQNGFTLDQQSRALNCISNNNGVYGFQGPSSLIHCTAANNADSGIVLFNKSTDNVSVIMNNISYGNGGYGMEINPSATRRPKWLKNNALGGNILGTYDEAINDAHDIEINTATLTEDPFVNSSIRDFSLNNSEGGGQLCRNGASTTNRFVTATSYIDIGAVQSAARAIVVG